MDGNDLPAGGEILTDGNITLDPAKTHTVVLTFSAQGYGSWNQQVLRAGGAALLKDLDGQPQSLIVTATTAPKPVAVVKTGTAQPEAAVKLESKTLEVLIDPEFPRIIRYKQKLADSTFEGQASSGRAVRVNKRQVTCAVAFKKIDDSTAEYRLQFAELGIEVPLLLSVKEDSVDLRFGDVIEKGSEKLKTLLLPEMVLLSASTENPKTELATLQNKIVDDYTESFGPLSGFAPTVGTQYGNTLFLSDGKVATGLISNHLESMQRVAWKIEALDSAKVCSAWRPFWRYREDDGELCESPWTKIIVTADQNKDGVADWQDAGIVFRRVMPLPFGSEFISKEVGQSAIMDFASMAQWPFLRILDQVKRTAFLTDGICQRYLIRGYTGEGHDSGNTDYGGHYNEKAGGLKDLNFLLGKAGDYNVRMGLHVNCTEVYPEAHRWDPKIFARDAQGNPIPAWKWIDQATKLDYRKDILAGGLCKSLDQMRAEIPKLDCIYFDAYFGGYDKDGWAAWKLASKLKSMGLPLGTEFTAALDTWATWSERIMFNSYLYRFLWNSNRGIYGFDPLLRGSESVGFMGWQDQKDLNTYIRATFSINLPCRYLQHFELLRWVKGSRAEFSHGVTVEQSGNNVVCKRDNRVIMTWDADGKNNRLFIPWEPLDEKKIYVWDEAGTSHKWELPPSWAGKNQVFLYRLTDLGRMLEKTLPVTNGSIDLSVSPNLPYVIYPDAAPDQQEMVWGEGGLVADPGFDSQGFKFWKPFPEDAKDSIKFEKRDTGDNCLVISNPSSAPVGVAQELSGLQGGRTYAASVWVSTENGRKATILVTPKGSKQSCQNSVAVTDVVNRNVDDSKLGTKFQRLKVIFSLPAWCASAKLELLADADPRGAKVEFDDVRVVTTEVPPESAKHTFYEDFEHVDEGLGPFVYAGSGQTMTHLSESNPGITDDVIAGRYSLKTLDEPVGVVVRTLPSFLPLKPSTQYRIAFDALADSGIYSLVIQGEADRPETVRKTLAIANGASHVNETFTTGPETGTFLTLTKPDKDGGKCVIDNLAIDEIGQAP